MKHATARNPGLPIMPLRAVSGSGQPGLRTHFARLIAALRRRAERRRQYRALSELNDHLLADIGVTREERARELERYFPTIL